MNTQETKAVEDAANEQAPTDGYVFFHYSDADIWKEGFIKGAQFLDELRKQSERPNLKEFYRVHECIGELEKDLKSNIRLSAYIQILENYVDSLESKPSEPETYVGEASEELIKDIEGVIDSRKWRSLYHNRYMLHSDDFKSVATEIAVLMQNRENQEESRKIAELLQAAKDALSTFFSIGCTEEAEIVQALIKAITNYKNQSK